MATGTCVAIARLGGLASQSVLESRGGASAVSVGVASNVSKQVAPKNLPITVETILVSLLQLLCIGIAETGLRFGCEIEGFIA